MSPFLHEVVVAGDRLEVRGPIGGYFVWEAMGAAAASRCSSSRAARAWCR